MNIVYSSAGFMPIYIPPKSAISLEHSCKGVRELELAQNLKDNIKGLYMQKRFWVEPIKQGGSI